MPLLRSKTIFLLLLLALAAYGQQKRIAILPTMDDGEPLMELTDLEYLTATLREIAGNILQGKYSIMTEKNIIDRLGKENTLKVVREGSLLELGRKINADYIGQAKLGRFSGNLTISFMLYSSESGMQVGSINGSAKDILGLLKVLKEKAPEMFKKLPGISNEKVVAYGQQKYIAILHTMDDGEPEMEYTDLNYLTTRLREIAGKVLQNNYNIMSMQNIIDRLGGMNDAREAANEGVEQLGRKIAADYIVQTRLGRFGGNLTISVELLDVKNGMVISKINGEAEDMVGLLYVFERKSPELFRKIN